MLTLIDSVLADKKSWCTTRQLNSSISTVLMLTGNYVASIEHALYTSMGMINEYAAAERLPIPSYGLLKRRNH